MATRMQQRRGTAAQWLSTNNGNGPVLNIGEIGYESDTNKFKIGDGVSHWVDLNYFADAVELGGNIDDYIPLTQKGAANGVATLNSDGVIPANQIPSLVGLDTEISSAVNTAVSNLVNAAPAALNTLGELAAALNNDEDFSSTVASELSLKASTEYVDNEIDTLTSTLTSDISTAVTTHNQDTTDVHGIADTSALVTLSGTQTLANKTLVGATFTSSGGGYVEGSTLASGLSLSASGAFGGFNFTGLEFSVNWSSFLSVGDKVYLYFSDASYNSVIWEVSSINSSLVELKTFDANVLSVDFSSMTVSTVKEALVSSFSVSSTEIAYLDGVTSNIQTQIDSKVSSSGVAELAQDAVGNSVGNGLSYDDSTGAISVDETEVQFRVADVTDTEIGYLNGVTSSIQDQLDDKASITGTETLENKTLINPVVTYRELTQPSITMLFQNGGHVYALRKSDGTYHIGPNGQNEWFGSYDSPVINLDSYPDTVGVRVLNSLWNQIFNGTIEGAASAGYISYDDGSNDYTVSPIELYRLDGVTSNIQTQLNSKASTVSLTDHAAETSTHGVSGSIVGTNNTQTLTNKTLTNPTITVYEISSPASVTLGGNGGAFYAFRKADGTFYIGPNGQNEWYSAGDTELMANIPLATQVRVLNSMWNAIGTFSFAAAQSAGYLVNNAEVATTTTVSNIEIKNLDGVTSNIQDQLDDKSPIASPTFTGTVTTDDLVVDGDFTVNGTNFAASATSITIEDNLVQLAHENAANTVDLGIVVGYNDGSAKHAGIVRDVSDSKWKLFKDVTTEPTTTVNFGQGSLDDLAVAGLEATSISATSATIGDVSNTELQYLNGVTSAIQTQLNSKLDSSTASSTYQTIVSGVSNTEIGYLDGVTSAIQTQLNDKAPLASPTFTGTVTLPNGTVTHDMIANGTIIDADINASAAIAQSKISGLTADLAAKSNVVSTINAQTGNYTLVLSDADKVVEMNVGSANTLTVPANADAAIAVGTRIHIVQTGSGQTTITPGSGVTVNGTPGLKSRAQWSAITLLKRATNTWVAFGDLTA